MFFKIIIQGDIANENQVLQWMVKQKTDESIEHIDREKLFEYIDNQDFLAVVWCKYLLWYISSIKYGLTFIIYTSTV